MTKPAIGFIGLGLMGSAMVERLQSQGHSLTVIANKSRENVDAAVARGATEVGTGRDVAEACDVVMLCVGTSAQVESRMRGPEGVIAGLREGAVVIDFGTSLPGSTRKLAEEVAAAGGAYLDAPLGRTPMHARDGLLNIMGAGDKAAFDKVRPVLDDLGENVFHLGASGTGHVIKLINNFCAQCMSNAFAEAFAMADRTGVDRQAVYDVMSAGPVASAMLGFIKAYAVEGNPDMLAFSVRNAAKDVGYYRQMAEDAGVKSFMAKGAMQALEEAISMGRGDTLVPEQVDFFARKFESG
ncbi:MAG: NAD(P)-dependent oxidoreductase [Boseongicola sp.]|nr:NAD(P)-dependent oxidoreductase [Boseongicola sp.]